MSKKRAIMFLGVNGTLSGAIINHVYEKHINQIAGGELDMLGFDVQPRTDLPVTAYHYCDLDRREYINDALGTISWASYNDIRLLICSSVMNLLTFDGGFSESSLYRSLQINLVGPSHFTLRFVEECLRVGARSRIVFVGSTAAHVGSADPAYAAAKAGFEGLARSISKYHAQQGITTTVVHTGIFASDMEARVSEARKATTIAATHVKRMGKLNEIRDLVLWNLLEASEFFTGQVVDINGGQHT